MIRPCWSFVWKSLDREPEMEWESKGYKTRSLKRAIERMADFLSRQDGECVVDLEARADHIAKYNRKKHEETYPNLHEVYDGKHALTEYIS